MRLFTRIIAATLTLTLVSGTSAFSQGSGEQRGHGMNHGEHAMGEGAQPPSLPSVCGETPAPAQTTASSAEPMAGMEGDAEKDTTKIGEAQSAYRDAMMKTHAPMMDGALASDPDIAFVCSMIPHHEGAVAMAKIVIQYGEDDFTRRLAEDVIASQENEIEQMREWLEKRAQ